MGEAGVFAPDERVELIDGEVVIMPPIGEEHSAETNRMNSRVGRSLGDRAIVSVQNPVIIRPDWEPLPDLALLRPREDFYQRAKPRPEDVFLLVEVSDTSLAFDREVKVPGYAAAGIPETWVVDVQARLLLVFREPSPEGYRRLATFGPGDRLSPAAFPDVEFLVTDLLPLP